MKRMVIAGGSGFVGSELKQRAAAKGYNVTILGRKAGPGIERWDPVAASRGDAGAVDELGRVLDGADAVVNLAGSSVGAGRLGKDHRREVIESRVDSTRAMKNAIHAAKTKPKVWLNASATGYYGDTGDEVCDEQHAPGNIFLSEVCTAWEREAKSDQTRVVVARIGVVFDRNSEAWSKLRTPLKMGVAGPLGSGKQWMPWISLPDLTDALLFLIEDERANGPFNLVAPESIRQLELVRMAAKAYHRPAFLPAPAFGLKLLFGDLAENAILASTKAVPKGLESLGYPFKHRTFQDLLPSLL